MDKKNRVLIITGGSLPPAFLKSAAVFGKFNKIICADSGLEAVSRAGISFDYLIGDFDSVSPELLKQYEAVGADKIRRFPAEKDETDTEIAVRLALSLGAGEITLVGATGSRLDHTLANIHLLKMAMDEGVFACILDEHNKIYLIKQGIRLLKTGLYGPYLSLLPFTEQVVGLTLLGMKYPLTNHTLRMGESIGISNEVEEEEASIRLASGILLVMETSDEGRSGADTLTGCGTSGITLL